MILWKWADRSTALLRSSHTVCRPFYFTASNILKSQMGKQAIIQWAERKHWILLSSLSNLTQNISEVQLTKHLSDHNESIKSLTNIANIFWTWISRYLFMSQCLSSCTYFSQIWEIQFLLELYWYLNRWEFQSPWCSPIITFIQQL